MDGAMVVSLRKNLLSSVVNLVMGEEEVVVRDGLHMVETVKRHRLLAYVQEGKAWLNCQKRMFHLCSNSNVACQLVGLQLVELLCNQASMECVEKLMSTLMNTMQSLSKDHHEDAVRMHTNRIFVALLKRSHGLTDDIKKEYGTFVLKMMPSILTGLTMQTMTSDKVALQLSAGSVIETMLKEMPSTLQKFASKCETALVEIISRAYNSEEPNVKMAARVLASLHTCAKNDDMWHIFIEKILTAINSVLSSTITGRIDTRKQDPSAFDVLEKGFCHQFSFAQADRVMIWLGNFVDVLCMGLQTSSHQGRLCSLAPRVMQVAEAFLRIRSEAIGKQSAISEDGQTLPPCLIFAFLPNLHAFGLNILASLANRLGISMSRFQSQFASMLKMAFDASLPETRVEAYRTLSVIVEAYGAGCYPKLVQPFLVLIADDLLAHLQDLIDVQQVVEDRLKLSAMLSIGRRAKGSSKRKRNQTTALGLESKDTKDSMACKSRKTNRHDAEVNARLAGVLWCSILRACGPWIEFGHRNRISCTILKIVQFNASSHAVAAASSVAKVDAMSSPNIWYSCLALEASVPGEGGSQSNLFPAIVNVLMTNISSSSSNSSSSSSICSQREENGIEKVLSTPALLQSFMESYLHPRVPPLHVVYEVKGANISNATKNTRAFSSLRQAVLTDGENDDWDDQEMEEENDFNPNCNRNPNDRLNRYETMDETCVKNVQESFVDETKSSALKESCQETFFVQDDVVVLNGSVDTGLVSCSDDMCAKEQGAWVKCLKPSEEDVVVDKTELNQPKDGLGGGSSIESMTLCTKDDVNVDVDEAVGFESKIQPIPNELVKQPMMEGEEEEEEDEDDFPDIVCGDASDDSDE